MGIDSMFYQTRDGFCMAVCTSSKMPMMENLTIIGLRARHYYNAGYDIFGNKLYFENMDCKLLKN